ncbi:MAG TPA: DEAD/DEAH box helicase family protein [Egibacteraceae bacterium]|nr:DEAD/DEAH box helicase family protein [Egibacteraceae bacterium]
MRPDHDQAVMHEARPCCRHREENARLRRELAESRRELEELRREVAKLGGWHARPFQGHEGLDPHARAGPRLATPASGSPPRPVSAGGLPHADQRASRQDKLALYRALFAGREDVYARRWENRAKATSGWAPVHRGGRDIPRHQREYLPLTDDVVAAHLEGRDTIGLYPLLADDTCRLLACDFDKATWRLDAQAYCEAAETARVPTALEISRSGNGAHVWTFFTGPVAAADARALGAALLREAIALRGELDVDSYDRFLPSQDYLPQQGFGNLIALPLQGECRERNTTVFVDPRTFEPWPDQFAFLSSLARMTPADVRRTVEDLRPVTVGPDARPHRSTLRPEPRPPAVIRAQLAGMLAIRRAGIPPSLYATLKHLAVLHNPEFHKNQQLRLSNHATPRFIRCYAEDLEHLRLPRGLTEAATKLIEEAGSRLEIVDARSEPARIEAAFAGALTHVQARAVDELGRHELGVLEAPPGAGKTVMGCALIARHRTPTLVLVDRRELLDQWRSQLRTHLAIEAGQIGAGKRQPTWTVDVATFQTVTRSQDPAALLDGYGLVVIDECHHVAAPTVERTVRDVRARRWLGLTATPQRPDGLKEIMVMQCGPIRHRIDRTTDDLVRRLHVHDTQLAVDTSTDGLTRGEVLALVHAALVEDARRTAQICDDVVRAMGQGRNCLVLSGRTEHVDALADGLRRSGLDPLVLHGGLATKTRRGVHARLATDSQLLLVATDRYIGEGFDCPRLDTLFLAFPVSAPQRITQYAGRILREHPGKDTAEVHDYRDAGVPMLEAMCRRRRAGYRKLRFSTDPPAARAPRLPLPAAGGPPATRPEPASEPAGPSSPTSAQVRAWARTAGLVVGERGRLAAEVWQAYRSART